MITCRDVVGNSILLDDFIVTSSSTDDYVKLNVGRVIGYTPQKIKVYLLEDRGPFRKQEINIFPNSNSIVKITDKQTIDKLKEKWNEITKRSQR